MLKAAKGNDWKSRLKVAWSPRIARLGRLFGLSWPRLGQLLGREAMIGQLRSMGPARVVDPAAKSLDVVCLTMIGSNRIAFVETVLGRALRARGHRVRYVVCDQVLPVCEVKWEENQPDWPRLCGKCYSFARAYLLATGCEVLAASDLIRGQKADRDWPEYVESALLKHCHVGVLPADDPQIEQRRGLFRGSAAVAEAIGRKLVEMRPDRVIMSHGIYCTWGPARETLVEAGIPVLTYGEGKKRDTEKFNWNTSADWWDVSQEWAKVRETPLTPSQAKIIDDYLLSRRSHAKDARVYNFGPEESVEDTRRRFRLDPHKPTFVLFTNVLWDAASAQREIVFGNPVEWVIETIRWFAAHPDRQLIVKIHPAEVVIGTRQPFARLIAEQLPQLPANVRVIEPQEKVNSWSILRVADLGIVHTSTVGMELPLEGVPCAVVSRTHFRERGFTVDVNSRQEYYHMLEHWNPASVDRQRMVDLARRYAYLLFERYQLPFPFLFEPQVLDSRAFQHVGEKELLAHPTIQVFLRGIEQQTEFLLDATSH